MAVSLLRRSDARKGRQPSAPDESKAHESAESKQTEQEEETGGADEPGEEGPDAVRKGSKADYRGRETPGRKRNSPGSKQTKAPMDSDCGCGGKKGKKGGCSCSGKKDGGMGGPGELYGSTVRQKNAKDSSCGMRRGDSLTVHEYLAACDLGIQNQPISYIRARLDATERLDLKCGRGSISQGEKCHVGTARGSSPSREVLGYKQSHTGLKEQAFGRINGKVLSNKQVRQVERGIVAAEQRTGKIQKLSEAQKAALIATRGTQSRRSVLHMIRNVPSKNLKASIKAHENTADPGMFALNQVAKRELFNRRIQTGANILGAGLALGAVAASTIQTRDSDSIWAEGYQP